MTDTKKQEPKNKAGDIISTDSKNGIIYVQHPVTLAQKKELLKKGKIIDAQFMPKKADD